MKRLCLFTIYSKNGKLMRHVEYWLHAFRIFGCEICVVVNGFFSEKDTKTLESLADYVMFRANQGFDVAAYMEAWNVYKYRIPTEFDEVIFCNDTMYGPFKRLNDIFGIMEKKDIDFWGVNRVNASYISHIQSYFLVFNKRILSFRVLELYWKIIEPHIKSNQIIELYAYFEMGIYQYLISKGFNADVYCILDNEDIYMNADFCIEKYGLPILKKKFFEKYFNYRKWERIRKALEKTSYPISIIEDTEELHDLNCEEENDIISYYNQPTTSLDKVIGFIKEHPRIYIYGAGIIASKIYWRFRNYFVNFCGFVVSDSSNESKKELFGYSIETFSFSMDGGIIIAMNKDDSLRIKSKLEKDSALSLYE